jgi:hypothetical protein
MTMDELAATTPEIAPHVIWDALTLALMAQRGGLPASMQPALEKAYAVLAARVEPAAKNLIERKYG